MYNHALVYGNVISVLSRENNLHYNHGVSQNQDRKEDIPFKKLGLDVARSLTPSFKHRLTPHIAYNTTPRFVYSHYFSTSSSWRTGDDLAQNYVPAHLVRLFLTGQCLARHGARP
eukprot:3551149-Heterocapsa_arctica.AAC.1